MTTKMYKASLRVTFLCFCSVPKKSIAKSIVNHLVLSDKEIQEVASIDVHTYRSDSKRITFGIMITAFSPYNEITIILSGLLPSDFWHLNVASYSSPIRKTEQM